MTKSTEKWIEEWQRDNEKKYSLNTKVIGVEGNFVHLEFISAEAYSTNDIKKLNKSLDLIFVGEEE